MRRPRNPRRPRQALRSHRPCGGPCLAQPRSEYLPQSLIWPGGVSGRERCPHLSGGPRLVAGADPGRPRCPGTTSATASRAADIRCGLLGLSDTVWPASRSENRASGAVAARAGSRTRAVNSQSSVISPSVFCRTGGANRRLSTVASSNGSGPVSRSAISPSGPGASRSRPQSPGPRPPTPAPTRVKGAVALMPAGATMLAAGHTRRRPHVGGGDRDLGSAARGLEPPGHDHGARALRAVRFEDRELNDAQRDHEPGERDQHHADPPPGRGSPRPIRPDLPSGGSRVSAAHRSTCASKTPPPGAANLRLARSDRAILRLCARDGRATRVRRGPVAVGPGRTSPKTTIGQTSLVREVLGHARECGPAPRPCRRTGAEPLRAERPWPQAGSGPTRGFWRSVNTARSARPAAARRTGSAASSRVCISRSRSSRPDPRVEAHAEWIASNTTCSRWRGGRRGCAVRQLRIHSGTGLQQPQPPPNDQPTSAAVHQGRARPTLSSSVSEPGGGMRGGRDVGEAGDRRRPRDAGPAPRPVGQHRLVGLAAVAGDPERPRRGGAHRQPGRT